MERPLLEALPSCCTAGAAHALTTPGRRGWTGEGWCKSGPASAVWASVSLCQICGCGTDFHRVRLTGPLQVVQACHDLSVICDVQGPKWRAFETCTTQACAAASLRLWNSTNRAATRSDMQLKSARTTLRRALDRSNHPQTLHCCDTHTMRQGPGVEMRPRVACLARSLPPIHHTRHANHVCFASKDGSDGSDSELMDGSSRDMSPAARQIFKEVILIPHAAARPSLVLSCLTACSSVHAPCCQPPKTPESNASNPGIRARHPCHGRSHPPAALLQATENILKLNEGRVRALQELKAANDKIKELEGALETAVTQISHLSSAAAPSAPATPPAGSPPSQAEEIVLLYETGWDQVYVHYSLDGGEWTRLPGERMEPGSRQYAGRQVIRLVSQPAALSVKGSLLHHLGCLWMYPGGRWWVLQRPTPPEGCGLQRGHFLPCCVESTEQSTVLVNCALTLACVRCFSAERTPTGVCADQRGGNF